MGGPERRQRAALAEFLRTRRARLQPAAIGLAPGDRRRTLGLRREEVALLANIGIAWYTALEQGRDVHASTGVLEGLAAALRLTPDERRHLFLLADQALPLVPIHTVEDVSLALRRIIDDLEPDPAVVLGRRWDYLYWNRGAAAVFTLAAPPPHPRNYLWCLFVDRTLRRAGWEQVARTALAQFRADSARYPDDQGFQELLDDLERASPEFRVWWPQHDVHSSLDCRKELMHPLVGRLILQRTSLQMPTAPDLKIVIYTPLPEADAAAKLQRLSRLAEEAGRTSDARPPCMQQRYIPADHAANPPHLRAKSGARGLLIPSRHIRPILGCHELLVERVLAGRRRPISSRVRRPRAIDGSLRRRDRRH